MASPSIRFVLFFLIIPLYWTTAQPEGRVWEEKFRAIPEPGRIRDYMKLLSARPHHIGSAYGKQNAEWMLARFKEWGWEATIESYDVLFPTPKERVLELVAPTRFVASLREPPLAEDPYSQLQDEQLPTYNAFSIDGEVTAPLVYVNYGIAEDYEQLERMGVSVQGCIVIARYGASWRGIKPKVAAEHGAVGCLIYSDPKNDGYYQGDVFPKGPFRPEFGAQRGSVMDMPIHSGDPLTPGVPATPQAKRLALADVQTFTKIPTLPISYADAKPLLETLGGPVVPESWRGALPLTYKVGPGPARVHLKVKCNWDLVKIHNVVARLKGSAYPDEWVIRGNHHDAWVNGAEDPISGLAPMLEEARAMGMLLKQGWRPKRTIVYCAWDGEEQGLLGSTEWVEAHADELRSKAVLYINSDSNGRGYLSMGGSHSLEQFINEVAKEITDPETNLSVWKRLHLLRIKNAAREVRAELRSSSTMKIDALGSGSDYTPFLEHLGIASLNLGFGGEDRDGIYHSIYDDYYWYTTFSDTSFLYGRALAQTAGTAVMRVADAELLPFEFTRQAATFAQYVDELKKLSQEKRDEIIERNRQLDEGVFAATSDPRRPTLPPTKEPVPPFLNFAPLENGSAHLTESAKRLKDALDQARSSTTSKTALINKNLIRSERYLTDDAGLPNRPWFKHLIYAPGLYTGYGVKTIPGVREAIEQKKWKEAEQEIVRAGKVLDDVARFLDAITADVTRAAN